MLDMKVAIDAKEIRKKVSSKKSKRTFNLRDDIFEPFQKACGGRKVSETIELLMKAYLDSDKK